jgi:prevent-host-death family protein
MIAAMKTVTALDLRKHVGQLLDEAASGERIVIERAGQPLCALVPLRDLEVTDPAAKLQRELRAIAELQRLARQYPFPKGFDAVQTIRDGRQQRDDQILRAVDAARERRRGR